MDHPDLGVAIAVRLLLSNRIEDWRLLEFRHVKACETMSGVRHMQPHRPAKGLQSRVMAQPVTRLGARDPSAAFRRKEKESKA